MKFLVLALLIAAPGWAKEPSPRPAPKKSGAVVIERKEIKACIESGGACLKESRAVPFSKDGEVIGYKIVSIKKGSLLERIKLREGDVILSANGETLGDIYKIPFLIVKLTGVKKVNLEVLRAKKPLTITYEVKD